MWLFERLGAPDRQDGLKELTLTTNGSQLARFARDLVTAGVRRINVSLDTRDAGHVPRASPAGAISTRCWPASTPPTRPGSQIKINTVALKGVNEDEIPDLMRWAHGRGFDFTLIETMPLGEIDGDRIDQYLPLSLVRARLAQRFHAGRQPLSHRRPGALCATSRKPAAGSASSRRSPTISAKAATACG